jgi:hypothetical protein
MTKANSVSIPAGFNAASKASVQAALALILTDGVDTWEDAQDDIAIIAPFLETEIESVFSGGFVFYSDVPYALILPAESFELSTGGIVGIVDSTVILPPAVDISVVALSPTVATGAAIPVPSAGVVINSPAPVVAIGVAIQVPVDVVVVTALTPAVDVPTGVQVLVPTAGVMIAGLAPTEVGKPRLEVPVPAAALVLDGIAPVIAIGAAVEVPAAAVVVVGFAPRIGGPGYWSSWAEQNYGWWPESYPDWWAN